MRIALLPLLLVAIPANGAVDFDREIRPILSENCFTCHGPDAAQRMAKLRFDVPDGGAFTNNVVNPGKSAESRLIQRVTEATPARRMPPPSTGHTLTPAQIELLKQWIDQGAKWQTHWAFVPPVRPEPPAVKESGLGQKRHRQLYPRPP